MGKSIAGLIIGIASFILCFMSVPTTAISTLNLSIIALPMAIVALCISVSGRRTCAAQGRSAGVGTAGMIVGIIAVVFTAIMFCACGVCSICATCGACGLQAAAGV